MSIASHSNQQWFEEVLQPTIDILHGFVNGTHLWKDLDLRAFFKTFLSDLEMVGLDNDTVELYVQKILSGLLTLQAEKFNDPELPLKVLAEIALSHPLERVFYLEYWKSYRKLKTKLPQVNDQDIINTYHLRKNLAAFIQYLENASVRI